MPKNILKKQSVPTTNFIVHLDKIDKASLQNKYQLYCIEVPNSFTFLRDANKFAKLHNAYKEQLELPYYFFSPKRQIFILAPKTESQNNPISLTFDFLDDQTVVGQEKNTLELCTRENLHILMKLFLSSWYHKAHRTCQGNYFYIHSKEDKAKATALVVKIQASKRPFEFEIKPEAAYLLKANEKSDPQYANRDTYLEKLQGEIYYRQIKKSEAIERLKNKKELHTLYKTVTKYDRQNLPWLKNPSIKWFEDYDKITRCKSYLLQKFQGKLIAYYNEEMGSGSVEKQSHEMAKIEPLSQFGTKGRQGRTKGYGYNEKTGEGTGLYLKLMGEIGLFDNRFKETGNANKIPFQRYVEFFNKHYGKKYQIQFVEINKEDLNNTEKPVLSLHDAEKKLFDEEGFLFVYDDPYKTLNSAFSSKLALQNMNVNVNHADERTIDSYFNYEMLGDCLEHLGSSFEEISKKLTEEAKTIKDLYKKEQEEKGEVSDEAKEKRKKHQQLKKHFDLITNKIEVCLNDLLLKYYLVNKMQIANASTPNQTLPCLLQYPNLVNYAFMHGNYLMYANEENVLQFIDLRHKIGKDQRLEFLKNLGIDWFEVEKDFAKRNYTRNANGEYRTYVKNGEVRNKHLETLKKTHFIFAKELVLTIEYTEERVLHKYDDKKKGKSQRKGEQKTALEGVWYSPEKSIYTVGYKSLNITADDSVIVRHLYYYQKPENFKIDDGLLQTLTVQFVRNQQYTVYPYFFDLLRLYEKDIMQMQTESV